MKNNITTKPYIVISNPDGKKDKVILNKDKIIVGRLKDSNDISLLPDPQQLVTRYMHCSFEVRNSTPFIVDNASKNGTFIRQKNIMQQVKGEVKLQDGDVIMILSSVGSNEPARYWELLFKDPLATGNIQSYTAAIEYDWIQAKLFIKNGKEATEVADLTPLEHKLLRYMDKKNKSNNNVPVMCTYDEIISALWEDSYSHTTNDVNHIVAALRKKLEVDYKNPVFLLNIRGMGYRLITNP